MHQCSCVGFTGQQGRAHLPTAQPLSEVVLEKKESGRELDVRIQAIEHAFRTGAVKVETVIDTARKFEVYLKGEK